MIADNALMLWKHNAILMLTADYLSLKIKN
jgi:hypothetical protein